MSFDMKSFEGLVNSAYSKGIDNCTEGIKDIRAVQEEGRRKGVLPKTPSKNSPGMHLESMTIMGEDKKLDATRGNTSVEER